MVKSTELGLTVSYIDALYRLQNGRAFLVVRALISSSIGSNPQSKVIKRRRIADYQAAQMFE